MSRPDILHVRNGFYCVISAALFLLGGILGCSTLRGFEIYREGYVQNPQSADSSCLGSVSIVVGAEVDLHEWSQVGLVHIRPGMYTSPCDEVSAKRIIQQEACQVKASLAQIYDEIKPDGVWSECYEARVRLFKQRE